MSDHADTIREALLHSDPTDYTRMRLAADALDALAARCDALEGALREADSVINAARVFGEIADRFDGSTWRVGPSPLYAVLDECRAVQVALVAYDAALAAGTIREESTTESHREGTPGAESRGRGREFGAQASPAATGGDFGPERASVAHERQLRVAVVEGVLELMKSAGTLQEEHDAIIPHGNGYSCWFIASYKSQEIPSTYPLTAEEILDRIDARAAAGERQEI
jgi:hypothetical protein